MSELVIEYKVCRICQESKLISEFYIRKDGKKEKHRSECNSCSKKGRIERSHRDIELTRQKDRDRCKRDREKRKEQGKQYRLKYAAELKIRKSIEKKKNRGRYNASSALRKSIQKRALAKWADKKKIKVIYEKSKRLSVWLEQEFHVDHIVPLTSDLVCGLHCEANLRILPGLENISKGNRWWPDMW